MKPHDKKLIGIYISEHLDTQIEKYIRAENAKNPDRNLNKSKFYREAAIEKMGITNIIDIRDRRINNVVKRNKKEAI